ncbi:MAG: GWxTD domain-containing protein [Calditrichaeota bacterium]|nr:MAG: GWxTD domain-containing protein [Calditrichota bacterium]
MKAVAPILLVLALLASLPAQYLATPELSGVGLPYFNAEVFPTFSEDGQERVVRMYVQMINDDITFLQRDSIYQGEVQIDVFLTSSDKKFTFNRSVTRKVEATKFAQTNSREISNVFLTEIPVQPGEYQAVVTVTDKNSGKQVNRKIIFNVPDFSDYPFMISDILVFTDYETDSLGRIVSFQPNLTGNFDRQSPYVFLYFNTFSKDTTDSLIIGYVVRDPNGMIGIRNQYQVSPKGGVFRKHFIRLPRDQFDKSNYAVEVIAQQGEKQFALKKHFSFYWTVSPYSPKDLDLALEQLRYIAREDSIRYFRNKSFEEKQAFFQRFWKRMDPNPETEKNELMDEYYRRVNYANRYFTSPGEAGWKSDRGRIFIKFGQPDDVERHPFEINSQPFEIWRYYSLRKTFLFIDRTGFGDYYLHPDYWNQEFN